MRHFPTLEESIEHLRTIQIRGVVVNVPPTSLRVPVMAPVVFEPIGPRTLLGEAPHWDHKAQLLYYVDILKSTVYRFNPKNKELTSVKIDGGLVSLVIPIEDKKNQFIITVGRNLSILTWDGKSDTPTKVEHLHTVDTEEEKADFSVFNDGKVDPTGRLWAGTRTTLGEDDFARHKPGVGSLYSFTKGQQPIKHLTGLKISNGLAWSKDLKTMYHIDTDDNKVHAFDFDPVKGKIANQRTAFDFTENNIKGFPDGMTIDTEDKLWVACFGGGQVIRIDPTSGKLLSSLAIPANNVTSATFGGPQLDELYVTTATAFIKASEEDLKNKPDLGKTFRVTGVGAKGFQNHYATDLLSE
uniref:Regucalcin n=1 Tax=Timema genevievae TaxID=629358 RepID=A0A7R9PHP0_TIMGE|nr:unnamed protein product [Timema genevievae]